MDLNQIVWYLNQGGPIAWTIIAVAGYRLYQLFMSALEENKKQTALLEELVRRANLTRWQVKK